MPEVIFCKQFVRVPPLLRETLAIGFVFWFGCTSWTPFSTLLINMKIEILKWYLAFTLFPCTFFLLPLFPLPQAAWQWNALQIYGWLLLVNVLQDAKQPFVPPSIQTLWRAEQNGNKRTHVQLTGNVTAATAPDSEFPPSTPHISLISLNKGWEYHRLLWHIYHDNFPPLLLHLSTLYKLRHVELGKPTRSG